MDLGKAPAAGTIALIVVTSLITLLMTVFGKATAEWMLNQILRPISFIKEALYRWIAPRNPLSISLRSYKRHVRRSNLTRIENPVGPHLDVPLEHAFAPLKLISSVTEESVDLFSQAAIQHRSIVLGGPGTGKTTLMKSLVTSVINGQVREENLINLIPVFVVLRNLAKKTHTVEQAIVAAFADYHFPGADKFVESALSQGKMLIILDGLDEVGANREYVSEQIQRFCEHDDQRAHRNRLIVTCREHSYRTKDLQSVIPEIVRVEPFANHHMRVFLGGWPTHKGKTAIKLYGLIQSDPQTIDICRNPLLLTIITGLYLDTENFELPTSREQFYKDAVEELLVNRPARRQMKQTYDADDKRQILERVALERLETVARHEDPEEFTQDGLRQKAEQVLNLEKFDPRELIKELVEINGIIKPASEGTYTCAHRTIQEYFAAREAGRTRETKDVVEHFSSRPEFIEVLYFYCGLISNIPSLASIINTLIGQERWLEAARCMLYMKEPPDSVQVERVAAELYKLVSPSSEYKAPLEVLSSLSQRRAHEFQSARESFALAVDNLAEFYGESGAPALESALATSPEAAMKVIPRFLRHQSPRWKEAAIHLLRDIGTDEALDLLVQLLSDKDPFVRDKAGRTLANMLKGRQGDLRKRAALLPPRVDACVWPLEKYFPGNLAINIAESLSEPLDTKSEAINCAARALRARDNSTRAERAFLTQWRQIPRDLMLRRWAYFMGKLLGQSGYALSIALLCALTVMHIYGYRNNQAVIYTVSPIHIYKIDVQFFDDVEKQADRINTDISARFPPNAAGFWRILPQNWGVEPVVPEGKDKAYELVKDLRYVSRKPNLLKSDIAALHNVEGLVSKDDVIQLQDKMSTLLKQLPSLQNAQFGLVKPNLSFHFLTIFMFILYGYFPRAVSQVLIRRQKTRRQLSSWTVKSLIIFGKIMPIVVVSLIFQQQFSDRQTFLLLILLLPLASTGIGFLLMWINWPKNPLFSVLFDFFLPTATGKANQQAMLADRVSPITK